jgi:hypothetical protein
MLFPVPAVFAPVLPAAPVPDVALAVAPALLVAPVPALFVVPVPALGPAAPAPAPAPPAASVPVLVPAMPVEVTVGEGLASVPAVATFAAADFESLLQLAQTAAQTMKGARKPGVRSPNLSAVASYKLIEYSTMLAACLTPGLTVMSRHTLELSRSAHVRTTITRH